MEEADFSSIAANTEGCLAADLELLVDRAIHSASIRFIQSQSSSSSQRHHIHHPQLTHSADHAPHEPQHEMTPNHHALTEGNNHEGQEEKEGDGDRRTEHKTTSDVSGDEEEEEEEQGDDELEAGGLRSYGFRIEQQDFIAAQEGFTPSSLKGIKLHKSEVSWSDIGGTPYPFYVFSCLLPSTSP